MSVGRPQSAAGSDELVQSPTSVPANTSITVWTMSQEVRGIVAKAKGEPVSMETIVIPDPGPGDVIVTIQACGVCHTDLHYREGGINDEFPFLLGHEAAGIVERDRRRCHPRRGRRLRHPQLAGGVRRVPCVQAWAKRSTASTPTTPSKKMTLTDGTELSPALGIGAFCDKTLVAPGTVHEGGPGRPASGSRPARLRRDGRPRCRDEHRRGHPRPVGRRVRLRWRR